MAKDEFKALDKDIQSHIDRLKKHPPKTLEALANELSGTGLEISKDVLALLVQLRGWSYEQMTALNDQMEDMNARLAEVEAPQDSIIVPEDAEKLMALIEATKQLVQRNLELNPGDDIRSGLLAMQQLANECGELVVDSTLNEEEEEEGEPGDEETDSDSETDEEEEDDAPQLTTGTGS